MVAFLSFSVRILIEVKCMNNKIKTNVLLLTFEKQAATASFGQTSPEALWEAALIYYCPTVSLISLQPIKSTTLSTRAKPHFSTCVTFRYVCASPAPSIHERGGHALTFGIVLTNVPIFIGLGLMRSIFQLQPLTIIATRQLGRDYDERILWIGCAKPRFYTGVVIQW